MFDHLGKFYKVGQAKNFSATLHIYINVHMSVYIQQENSNCNLSQYTKNLNIQIAKLR